MGKILDIQCGDKEISVRGRNGYFNLKTVEVLILESGNIHIGMYSSKRGKSAPVSCYGSRDELYRVFAEISHLLRPYDAGLEKHKNDVKALKKMRVGRR